MLIKGLVYSIFIVMARTEMENYMAYTFSFTFTVMLEYDEKQVGTSIGLLDISIALISCDYTPPINYAHLLFL